MDRARQSRPPLAAGLHLADAVDDTVNTGSVALDDVVN
jgi:hypothetical protein